MSAALSAKASIALAKPAAVAAAKNALDAHVREIAKWHFTPATGSQFWLDWAKQAGWNPAKEVKGFADLLRFPNFTDEWLRDEQPERWVPKAYAKKPFFIFETGGTSGMPKQRVSWTDHLHDYSEFSDTLDDKFFPKNAHWLMAGPTGPRRLRLAVEHLANVRGGSCYHLDLDPRWVKRLIGKGLYEAAEAYKEHVVDQAITILRNRKNIHSLFTTPKILEAMAERTSLPGLGSGGVAFGQSGVS